MQGGGGAGGLQGYFTHKKQPGTPHSYEQGYLNHKKRVLEQECREVVEKAGYD